jgi:hypothetical protein
MKMKTDKLEFGNLTGGVRQISATRLFELLNEKNVLSMFSNERVCGMEVNKNGYISFHTKIGD